MSKKLIVSGKFFYASKTRTEDGSSEKTILMLEPDDKSLEKMEKAIESLNYKGNTTPIKIGTDANEGKVFIKAQTKYDIQMYFNASPEDDITIEQIGRGSEIAIEVKIDSVTFKRKESICAYLKAINIVTLEEPIEYNPFLIDSDTDTE